MLNISPRIYLLSAEQKALLAILDVSMLMNCHLHQSRSESEKSDKHGGFHSQEDLKFSSPNYLSRYIFCTEQGKSILLKETQKEPTPDVAVELEELEKIECDLQSREEPNDNIPLNADAHPANNTQLQDRENPSSRFMATSIVYQAGKLWIGTNSGHIFALNAAQATVSLLKNNPTRPGVDHFKGGDSVKEEQNDEFGRVVFRIHNNSILECLTASPLQSRLNNLMECHSSFDGQELSPENSVEIQNVNAGISRLLPLLHPLHVFPSQVELHTNAEHNIEHRNRCVLAINKWLKHDTDCSADTDPQSATVTLCLYAATSASNTYSYPLNV